jgi:ribosome-associated toxin RatA of RatAB toxin-antitoxin module
MFRLVNDIESYPDFLPWCRSARVLDPNPQALRATIEIARGPVQQSFTTINIIDQGQSIVMRLESGPFSHLEGSWRFASLGDDKSTACKIELEIDFDFSSRVVSLALGPVFNEICSTLVESFRTRAVAVYGRR